MRYRIRETGAVVDARKLRDYAAKKRIFLARREERWSEKVLGMVGADVVQTADKPAPGPGQRVVFDGAEQVDGVWREKWELSETVSPEALRKRLLQQLSREAQSRSRRGLVVDGVAVRTDPQAITRLTAAKASSRNGDRSFVDAEGTVHQLSQAQIDAIFDAVDDYLQAVENRHAQLAKELTESIDPSSVDTKAGWPA